jgi:hypothetical protein
MTTTLLLALTLTAGAAQAQAPAAPPSAAAQADPRLDSWLGCWRLDEDLAGTGARMCITPENGGVRLQTIVGVQKGINEVVIPDGVERAIVDAECKGTERAEWSQDGMRLFRTTEVTCNKETPRTIKSVAFLANGPAWVNVQYVSGQLSSNSVRVQRYRRSPNQNLADGSLAAQPKVKGMRADTAWSIEDVIEASGKIPADALQAALTEVRQPFSLSSKTLIALADADVPPSVIDLMIAVTYPKRFVVERSGGGGGGTTAMGISTGGGYFDPFMAPTAMGVHADCFSPYGYGYRSYYSMCGSYYSAYNYGFYPYGGSYYPNNYWNNGGWVAVNPPGSGTGSITARPDGEGRVVNGRGYTQVRRSEPEPTVSRGTSRGDGSAAGYAGASGASSGGSSGVSSGGYSSGSSGGGSSSGGSSSGDSGARTAVPRPPGGN